VIDLVAMPRPVDWNFPLFLHVFGAMVLVGAVVACVTALLLARGDSRLLRLGYFSLLAVGLPSYIVMRIGAQWIYSKEGWDDAPIDPAWTGIGFVVADGGAVVLLLTLIVGGVGVRKLSSGGGQRLLQITMWLSLLLLAALLVAVWAMGAKPD
jgi:NADH:ubiquinone oxidoreductase subunit 6 (subunit J)